jgi:hypothetical protein
MTYVINREDMREKVERALHDFGDLYTFDDIMGFIETGKMQSFTAGDTWIVTQVNEFPRRKVLDICLVVGFLQEATEALPQIYAFARSIGANRVTAVGRDGWWKFAEPGWYRVGGYFAKDLENGK